MRASLRPRRCVLATTLLAVSGSAAAADAPPPALPRPTIAIYGLKRGVLPAREPAAIVAWLQRHHFNAVFGGHRDAALSAALRRAGIKRFAEVALFVGAQHWRRHPESRPIDARGRRIRKQGWYAGVCPNQPWLQRAKLRQIERTVRRYGVDGVWLDFIRYPGRWESARPQLSQSCFCPVCTARFAADTGTRYPDDARTPAARARFILARHRERFVRWKISRIADFTRRAAAVVRRANPRALIGLFGVPLRPEEHDGAIHAILAQDYRALAPHVDVLSPMLYHRMLGRDPTWVSGFVRDLHQLTGKPVLPVVQACSVPSRLGDDELAATARAALRHPSRGVVLFSLSHFVRERRGPAWRRAAAVTGPRPPGSASAPRAPSR